MNLHTKALPLILLGAGVAGALDICYAMSFAAWMRDVPPQHLLQLVASGLLGLSAYDGGWATAAVGLAVHFALSLLFAFVYFLAALRLAPLHRRPALYGSLFGALVFLFMNFVALPLSAFPHPVRFTLVGSGSNLLSHLFFFGLPIALATRAAMRRLAA